MIEMLNSRTSITQRLRGAYRRLVLQNKGFISSAEEFLIYLLASSISTRDFLLITLNPHKH